MRIHFFEEYPTDEALSRAQLLSTPSTIFLAAPNPTAFSEAAARLYHWNPALTPAYWPLLARSYWVSPFAFTDELVQLQEEIATLADRPSGLSAKQTSASVLLDLELPLLQRQLFWQNAGAFRTNKRLIRSLFSTAEATGISLFTAEYPVPYRWMERLQQELGISYPIERFVHTRIAMFYTSLAPRRKWAEWLGHRMLRRTSAYRERFFVGLGTIATGVFGNEPILSPEALAQDLALLRQYQVNDVVIFRLGGLTPAYMDAIYPFLGDR